MKTVELIDAVRKHHNLPSDYAAAAYLGVTRAQISRYRNGRDFMGDQVAEKVAEDLGLDAGYVVACIHAERASDQPTRALWTGIAERLQKSGLAAAVILSTGFFSGGPDGGAMAGTNSPSEGLTPFCMCIM